MGVDLSFLAPLGSFLAPLGSFLVIVGGGAVWMFNRADRRREQRETGVIGILKAQNAELKAESRSRERDGNRWRDQLIGARIKPDPENWTDWESLTSEP